MGEEEELVLRATIRDELSAPLRQIRGEVRGVGDGVDLAGRQAGTASRGFGLLAKAGRAAGLALKAGFVGLIAAGYAGMRLVRASLDEAREAQKVSALTRAELKATGAQSWITARQIDRLSSSISRKAGIDDEAIATGANLLLTFKQVRNEVGRGNDVFNRATRAAVDLSAAGFGSIESGSKMMGKALNDPLKGITALSRAGVTFTEDQVKRIEGYVEENKLLEAQKIILGEVESQVGGAAAAQATWGDKASVLWGNMQERLGTALIPLLDRVNRWFVQDGGPALDRYIGLFETRGVPILEKYAGLFVNQGIPAARDFLEQVRPLAESALPAMATALGTIFDVVSDLAPKLADVFDGFNSLPDWAKAALVIGGGGIALADKLGARKLLGGGLLGGFSKASPMPVWVVNNAGGAAGGMPGVVGGGEGGRRGGRTSTPRAGVGLTIGRAAVTLTAAYFAADAVSRILGWQQAGPQQREREDQFRKKWGKSPLEQMEDATLGLFDRLKVDPGMGPLGLQRNDPGLNNKLAFATPDELKEARKWLLETYGVGFKILEQNGRLEDGFTKWARAAIKGAKGADERFTELLGGPLHGTGKAVDDVTGKTELSGAATRRVTRAMEQAWGEVRIGLIPLLGDLETIEKPHPAKVYLDGIGTAEARLAAFQSKLDGLNSAGVMGYDGPAPGPSSSDQLFDDLTGKGGGKHGGKGGGKHPRPVAGAPHGRTAPKSLTVADGAFPTTVHTSARDLDPAELRDAWEQFLNEWLRDREEAGAL